MQRAFALIATSRYGLAEEEVGARVRVKVKVRVRVANPNPNPNSDPNQLVRLLDVPLDEWSPR